MDSHLHGNDRGKWIPAFAGMTWRGTGMTWRGIGMTWREMGMTEGNGNNRIIMIKNYHN